MPIVQEHGRWRSVRTPDERKTAATNLVAKLDPRERTMLQKILNDYQTTGKSGIVGEVAEIEWDEQPMPVAEWLMNEELIGETGHDMYPQLRADMVELFEGDYHEAILTGAIGWGKDFFATTAVMRMLYELNCLKNPQHTLGLAQGEPIHIVPISKTIASARRVVFGGICKKLALANWFRGKYEETMEEVRFKKKGIYIVGGASQDAAALGLNVICAVVDECVTAETQILTPDGYFPVGALYDSSKNDLLTFGPILTYNEKTGESQVDAGFIRPASVTEVFEVRFDDGRAIKATARHPFLVRRPWSDLDYVFLKDLKPGDEVVNVDPARPEWCEEPVLREDAHRSGEEEDGRGGESPADGMFSASGSATQDQALEPSHEGGEGRHPGGRSGGRCLGSLREGRAPTNRTCSGDPRREEARTEHDTRQGKDRDRHGSPACDGRRDRRFGGAGLRSEGVHEGGAPAQEGRRNTHAEEETSGGVDARAAGWCRASHDEAVVGACLPGSDDRYQASLLSYPGVESEDRGGESEAARSVQALRGDEAEDQRQFGLAGEEGLFQVPGMGDYPEGDSEGGQDGDRLQVAVGEARDEALGRMLLRSQFPVRVSGRPVSLEREEAPRAAGLLGDHDGRHDRGDRDQAEGLPLQAQGTGQGRRLHAVLRGLGLEVRSVGRATSVARVVSIRSAGCHQTFDVMSLPGGNFIANGLVVHNSNFLGEGKVTTGSASAKAEDKATMIYNALARRVKARYKRHGVRGLVMLVSSKRSTSDFTERRIHTAIKQNDPGVFVRDYAIWNVHPGPYENQKWYRVSVNPKEGRCKLLERDEDTALPGSLVFKFLEDYLDEFRGDPDGATRDIAGIATDFIGRPFMTHRLMIDTMFQAQRLSPFTTGEWYTNTKLKIQWEKVLTQNANADPVPVCCPGAVRHVAIDMSVNQCATGLVVAHICGKTEVERRDPTTQEKVVEWAPVIHVDGVLRAVAPDGGDIDHAEVRAVIYRMIAEGYPIRSVSMDQFMAPPNLQLFKKRGLRTAEVGARTAHLKPYMTLRQTIYEQRITSPFHPILNKELRELEIDDKGAKIKHPPKGSQDLADALANCVYYLSEHGQLGDPLGPSLGITTRESLGKAPKWSQGDTIWPDEEDEAVEQRSAKPDNGEGYSSWLV